MYKLSNEDAYLVSQNPKNARGADGCLQVIGDWTHVRDSDANSIVAALERYRTRPIHLLSHIEPTLARGYVQRQQISTTEFETKAVFFQERLEAEKRRCSDSSNRKF